MASSENGFIAMTLAVRSGLPHPVAPQQDSQSTERRSSRLRLCIVFLRMQEGGPLMAVHVRGLDWLNFFLADVQTGVGPFLAIYLAQNHWDPEHVGIALTAGGIAGIVTQAPVGWLVDRLRGKRGLIAAGVAALCAGSLTMALRPSVLSVMTAQVLIGGMSSIFNPAIAAVSLGLVGRQLFDRRQGRNQSWNAAGNLAAAVAMGLIGTYVGPRWIFYLVVGFAMPAFLSLLLIRPDEIDYEAARGADDGADAAKVGSKRLLKDRPLLIFLACAVLFHCANAAMLPLLGEMLSQGDAKRAPLFMMLCESISPKSGSIAALAQW